MTLPRHGPGLSGRVLVFSQFIELTDVTCPYCGAKPGEPCLKANGQPTTYVHSKRQDASR